MSLYAIIRNAYDPETGVFNLSEENIEMKGELDGNLCRCTGYKPILQAAKTFITQDLKGTLEVIEQPSSTVGYVGSEDDEAELLRSSVSCGRPGGCCRDLPDTLEKQSSAESSTENASSGETSISSQEEIQLLSGASYGKPMKSREAYPTKSGHVEGIKTSTKVEAPPPITDGAAVQFNFKQYEVGSEIIYPAALRKHKYVPLYFGNGKKSWLRPTSLLELTTIMAAYPSCKIVSGASEVQVEVRFKNMDYAVSVYIGDIDDLSRINVPNNDTSVHAMRELVVGGNASLSDLEDACNTLSTKLGKRGGVLKALSKQLRYFAGRQIRNVATLAGNIATASPISDLNPVLIAAEASLTCVSKEDEIKLPLSSFFAAYRTTTLPPGGVIKSINIPLSSGGDLEIIKAYKQAKRKEDDIAIVNACYRIQLAPDGRVTAAKFVYGGLAPITIAAKAGQTIIGKNWKDTGTLDAVIYGLGKEFDLRFGVPGGMASYRRALALSLFFRFWHESIAELGIGKFDPDIVDEIHRSISQGGRDNFNPHEQRVVGKQLPHLSGLKHATGEAQYVDDMPRHNRELYASMVMSTRAHAKLKSIDWSPALESGLAIGYVDHTSIPQEYNIWGSIVKDEPFFVVDEVTSHGQPIGLVYAESAQQAQAAARAVKIDYEDLPLILTIEEAIAAKSFYPYSKELRKGASNPDPAGMKDTWSQCDRIFEGTSKVGGQEHFYLETHAALVIPGAEDASMEVWATTQNT